MRLKRAMLCLAVLYCGVPGILFAQTEPIFFEIPTALLSPVGAGARAAGKGFAFIGVADDATAASHNPGGLTQLERPEISIVGSSFVLVDDLGSSSFQEDPLDNLKFDFVSVVLPPITLLGRKVVASLQVQRSFGSKDSLNFDYISTSEGSPNIDLTFRRKGDLYNFSPAVAVQITRNFSVGVAFHIWPSFFDSGLETDTTVQAGGGEINSQSDFSYEGFRVTAGFLWQIDRTFTLGGVFNSPYTATIKGHRARVRSGEIEESFSETLDVDIPLSYGLGLSARLSDLYTLSMDVTWVKWSDFRVQTPQSSFFLSVPTDQGNNLDVVVFPEFRTPSRGDTTSVRLGMEYLGFILSRQDDIFIIPVRAGFFYDPEPSYQGTEDFFGFGLGIGITQPERFSFDFAYTFRTGTRTRLVVTDRELVVTDRELVQEIDNTIYEHDFLASLIIYF